MYSWSAKITRALDARTTPARWEVGSFLVAKFVHIRFIARSLAPFALSSALADPMVLSKFYSHWCRKKPLTISPSSSHSPLSVSISQRPLDFSWKLIGKFMVV